MPDKLIEIFEHQEAYMHKLLPTYIHNGFGEHASWPWDLNGRKSQEQFRLLAWRYTEEIIEAGETYYGSSNHENLKEELADALHFLIELCIASGVRRAEMLTGH